MNYVTLGPVHLRISSKHIAPWGYARLMIGGLSFFSRTNSQEVMLASYQPKGSTWHWSFYLARDKAPHRRWVERSTLRRGQWHDYYRLPFKRVLIVSWQDYHHDVPEL